MKHKNTLLAFIALSAATLVSTASAQEPIVLQTGAFAPPGTVFLEFWQKFKTNVERDSGATIKVDLNTSCLLYTSPSPRDS